MELISPIRRNHVSQAGEGVLRPRRTPMKSLVVRASLAILALTIAVLPVRAEEWSKTYSISGRPDLRVTGLVSGSAELTEARRFLSGAA